eukprot:gene8032-9880_t
MSILSSLSKLNISTGIQNRTSVIGGHTNQGRENSTSVVSFRTNNWGLSKGRLHTLFIAINSQTTKPYLYGCGNNEYGQVGILDNGDDVKKSMIHQISSTGSGLPDDIIEVCCGDHHNLILDKNRLVYSMGWGLYNQLGHGRTNNEYSPKLIQDLKDVVIIKIACGTWHSLVLTNENEVYSFGFGEHGQLGHSNNESSPYPKLIDSLFDLKIVSISCGNRSSLFLDDQNRIFFCGYNKYGGLPLSLENNNHSNEFINSPKPIYQLGDYKLENIYSKQWSCFAW